MNKDKTLPLLVAYLIFIAIGAATGLLNIAWTYMQATFGLSLDSLGTLLSAAMLGGLIAAFISGALIGRFTIVPVLAGGMAFAGFGLFGYAVAPLWALLLLAAFITSIGKGAIDAGMNNFVAANYGTSQMNWLHACWGIGLTAAPAITAYFVLERNAGWQAAYVVMGAIILLLGLVIVATAPLWKLKKANPFGKARIQRKIPLSATIRRPIVLIGLLFFFLYGGIEIGAGQLSYTLFVEARGIPQETASSWVSGYWGSFTVGRMLMGLLAMRMGDKSLLGISFALAVTGAGMVLLNAGEMANLVGLLALGFGLAAPFPILILQTPRRVGSEHASNAIGFQVGCTGLGGAALSGAAGFFAEHVALESISVFIFLATVLALSTYRIMTWWEARQETALAA